MPVDVPKDVTLPRKLLNKAKAATPASAVGKGQVIPVDNREVSTQDVRTYRSLSTTTAAIRALARADGTVGTALHAAVQTANSGYKVQAYNTGTHQMDPAATRAVQTVIASLSTLYDYSKGFADKRGIDMVLEQALREVAETGAIAIEMPLNEQRLPDRLQVIDYSTLNWKSNGQGGRYPEQETGIGNPINLNIPTFWVSESHKPSNKVYANSMYESSLDNTFYFSEFIQDMRRVIRKAGSPRLIVILDLEKVVSSAPPEIKSDPEKLKAFLDRTKQDIEEQVSDMEPEDALVYYNVVEAKHLETNREKADYEALLNSLSGLLATSLKSHPSILGLRIGGSQSLSNTESLIYLKIARSLQTPVEEVISRALTLAVRLYGIDAYCSFKFEPIELRPQSELAAFKSMERAGILELLSLGFYTDEEAGILLGTGERAPGAPELSGTFFYKQSNSASVGTSLTDNAQGRAMQPNTPSSSGGRDNSKRPGTS